jgi:Uma2 family endonuclease
MLRRVTQSKDSRRRATYDDVLNAPEHMVAELIDGVLYTSPRPGFPHTISGSSLHGELYPPFHRARGGPGGWRIYYEPELHFGSDVLVPDCAGWRRERMPDTPKGSFSTLAPDWLCEILSPSTATLDRTAKLQVYARERVSHVWLIDPLAKTLEVLGLNASGWQILATHGGHERVRAVPFDALEIELAYLWDETPPS